MKRFDLELGVGVFIIVGILCLGYLSVKLARMDVFGAKGYDVYAVFSDVGGLKEGASVVIAGVEVGRIKRIRMADYEAKVIMSIHNEVKIQEDAIASVKTRGLIGEKYIQISPGGSEKIVPPGGQIRDTQPVVDLEQLISNFVFGRI